MKHLKKKNGFSMIELLTTVSIIAILILVFIFLMRNQKARGSDARRKADLENIKVSFEDYFNDNDCYPVDTVLEICGDESFQPYLDEIPCDPMTGTAYAYEPVANCAGYRAFAILEDATDPVIEKLNCDGTEGCGSTHGTAYNYGIAIGVPLNDFLPIPSPEIGYVYACDSAGVCNRFIGTSPILESCPVTYSEFDCQEACGNPSNRCSGF